MAGGTSQPGRTVTSRVLAILAALETTDGPLTLTEIARAAGLPLATAHRLVAELAEHRCLERDADGGYQVGLRLWELGLRGPLHTRLREAAMPYLQGLYESTRENVHLAVRDGADTLYVEKLSGFTSVPIVSRIGGRLPLHATGVGKALLAHAPVAFVESYLSGPLARPTRHTLIEPGRLLRDLTRVRTRGYAITREEMTLGNCSVAAPVLDSGGLAVAAVGVVVHTVRVDPDRLAPPVCRAAAGIADRLAALD